MLLKNNLISSHCVERYWNRTTIFPSRTEIFKFLPQKCLRKVNKPFTFNDGRTTRFYYKQHFFKQFQAETKANAKQQKIKQILNNTLKLNCWQLEINRFLLHLRYQPRMIWHILKNKQKNKCVYIHKVMRLMIMKMNMKMKKDHIATT